MSKAMIGIIADVAWIISIVLVSWGSYRLGWSHGKQASTDAVAVEEKAALAEAFEEADRTGQYPAFDKESKGRRVPNWAAGPKPY